MESGLVPAPEAIVYLGSHEGAMLDHAYVYADFNQKLLLQGLVNWLQETQTRELVITQMDKVLSF